MLFLDDEDKPLIFNEIGNFLRLSPVNQHDACKTVKIASSSTLRAKNASKTHFLPIKSAFIPMDTGASSYFIGSNVLAAPDGYGTRRAPRNGDQRPAKPVGGGIFTGWPISGH